MHPPQQGLYDPRYEHDSCGVGFVVDLKNRKMHSLIEQALQILRNLEHRGACGCESETGDGAGIILQTPHAFLARECDALGIRLPQPGAYGVGVGFPSDRRRRPQARRRNVRADRARGGPDAPRLARRAGPSGTARQGRPR